MKQLFIVLSLVVLLGSNLAAQSTRLEANIPFDFRIGAASLPGGTYLIDQEQGLVRLRGAKGGGAASISFGQDRKLRNPQNGALVFSRYGNLYFLQAVQGPNSTTARYLPKAKAEIALSKGAEKQEVIVALAR